MWRLAGWHKNLYLQLWPGNFLDKKGIGGNSGKNYRFISSRTDTDAKKAKGVEKF
jgi:hypothetical protein